MIQSSANRVLVTIASFVIIIYGMQAAASVLVPFLLAAFFAFLCSPPLLWLQRQGMPKGLALLIVVLAIVFLGGGLVRIIATSLAELGALLPAYEARLLEREASLTAMVDGMGLDLSGMVLADFLSAEVIAQTTANILAGLGRTLTNSFLILFTVVFMLLEAAGLPRKLRAAMGASDFSMTQFERLSKGIYNYLIIKSWMSLGTGITITILLMVLGIDFAVLWGLVAFLFNYIPNIGSIIAAVPAILLSFIQYGIESALIVALGYILVNGVVSYMIEPRFMGQGLDLSTLVVFLSLLFWGWVLGPAGLLLSPLLTVLLKMALESSEDTRWLAILLGSEKTAEALLNESEHQPHPAAAEPPELEERTVSPEREPEGSM
jgi:predicted PurR-regulated permease PerM